MSTDSSEERAPVARRWASWIRVVWLVCVPVTAWLDGPLYVDAGGDTSTSKASVAFSLATAVLGLALGVAMVKERRGGSNVASVATAALLATIASAFTGWFNPFVAFVDYAIVFGIPVGVGAVLGVWWRRRSSAKSTPR